MRIIKYSCLVCNNALELVPNKDGEEVIVCPECNGAMVDKYNLGIYQKRASDDKAYKQVKGDEFVSPAKREDHPKHLVIELDTVTSVPRVYYKGEEVDLKQKVTFEWSTKEEGQGSGGLHYIIQSAKRGLARNRLEFATGKFLKEYEEEESKKDSTIYVDGRSWGKSLIKILEEKED